MFLCTILRLHSLYILQCAEYMFAFTYLKLVSECKMLRSLLISVLVFILAACFDFLFMDVIVRL